jgi:hypothetical protein
MVSGMIGNMIAKGKVGIRAARYANEALVSLDLTEGAPGKPLNTSFEVGPEDVPFPLARDGGLLLQMVEPGKGSCRVGVDDRAAVGRTGGVLHGHG